MRKFALIVAVIGLLDASFLIATLFFGSQIIPVEWVRAKYDIVHSAANAEYSLFFGVPLPFLGAFCYGLMVVALTRKWNVLAFTISWGGLIMSTRLMIIQFGIIQVVCPFCVLSALSMTTLFILNTGILRREYRGKEQLAFA